jgi:hypothetical protein
MTRAGQGTEAAVRDRSRAATRLLALMCAWCRLVRDDDGRWRAPRPGEEGSAPMGFTHGICPRCLRREAAAAALGD